MIPYGLPIMKVDSLVMKDRNYYSLYQKVTVNLPVLNVLITLFIEGKPYQCSNTVLPMSLFGATWSHCYTRMAYLIWIRLSDFMYRYATRSIHFQGGNRLVQLYPRMKTFLLVPGLEPPTLYIVGRQH